MYCRVEDRSLQSTYSQRPLDLPLRCKKVLGETFLVGDLNWVHVLPGAGIVRFIPRYPLTDYRHGPPNKGFFIQRSGNFIETIASGASSVSLVASTPKLEVHEGWVQAGGRLTLVPADDPDWDGVECYYILEGRLLEEVTTTPEELAAADLVIVENLTEPRIFTAATNIRFLYFTTRPYFHQISRVMADLKRLARETEEKDGYTAAHCDRLQQLSFMTGKVLGLSAHRLSLIHI